MHCHHLCKVALLLVIISSDLQFHLGQCYSHLSLFAPFVETTEASLGSSSETEREGESGKIELSGENCSIVVAKFSETAFCQEKNRTLEGEMPYCYSKNPKNCMLSQK